VYSDWKQRQPSWLKNKDFIRAGKAGRQYEGFISKIQTGSAIFLNFLTGIFFFGTARLRASGDRARESYSSATERMKNKSCLVN